MAKKKPKVFKMILGLICAALLAGGGYYAGYSNHASSIISAIPKEKLTKEEKPATAVDSTNIKESESPDATIKPDAGKYIGKILSLSFVLLYIILHKIASIIKKIFHNNSKYAVLTLHICEYLFFLSV